MSTEDDSIHQQTRSFETALTEFLSTAHPTDGNLQGTYTLPAPAEDQPAYTVEITIAATGDERTQQCHESYCLHCNWSVSTAEYSRADVTRQMVDHAVETGHDIESTERAGTTETDSTARPTSDDISPGTRRAQSAQSPPRTDRR